MKPLLVSVLLCCAGPALADEAVSFRDALAARPAASAPHPTLFSFADVYRLTVAGPIAPLPLGDAAAEAPVRVAVSPAQSVEPRFAVRSVPQPDKWMLVLAGLALAGWVAHRRLSNSL